MAGSPPVDAVTWLFVPGDRPDRFAKATAAGADAVILDLEDAVAPAAKDDARAQVAQWLDDPARHDWVRINAEATSWHTGDVATLTGRAGLAGVMVPKSEDPDHLRRLREALGPGVAVVALVESALGVHRAVELARSGGVDRIAFGSIDFAGDIGADGSWDSMLAARSALVLASRLGGLPGPIDGVSTAWRDPEPLLADVAAARGLGFTGKLCIHPAQIAQVAAGFAPSAAEVEWANRVLAADREAGGAATSLDGKMVDRPVVATAQGILRRAAAVAATPPAARKD